MCLPPFLIVVYWVSLLTCDDGEGNADYGAVFCFCSFFCGGFGGLIGNFFDGFGRFDGGRSFDAFIFVCLDGW